MNSPPMIANSAKAYSPPKNRHIRMVWIFWATVTGIWRRMKQKYPKNKGVLRLKTSGEVHTIQLWSQFSGITLMPCDCEEDLILTKQNIIRLINL